MCRELNFHTDQIYHPFHRQNLVLQRAQKWLPASIAEQQHHGFATFYLHRRISRLLVDQNIVDPIEHRILRIRPGCNNKLGNSHQQLIHTISSPKHLLYRIALSLLTPNSRQRTLSACGFDTDPALKPIPPTCPILIDQAEMPVILLTKRGSDIQRYGYAVGAVTAQDSEQNLGHLADFSPPRIRR